MIDAVIVAGHARRARGVEGGAGGAYFTIENLPDKIPFAEIASDDARKEAPHWDCRGRNLGGSPFREGDFDGPRLSVVVSVLGTGIPGKRSPGSSQAARRAGRRPGRMRAGAGVRPQSGTG